MSQYLLTSPKTSPAALLSAALYYARVTSSGVGLVPAGTFDGLVLAANPEAFRAL